MPSDLISIEPPELRFPIELEKQVSCSLQFINQTHSDVAFKIKTTTPKNYCVRPNIGTIEPGNLCNVTVTMRALFEVPGELQSKDKFLVQTVFAPQGAQAEDILQELFHKASPDDLKETRLNVIYVKPCPALPQTPRALKENVAATRRVPSGFSFSFVLIVAVLGILVGFFLRGELYV
ncbi:hypothetical protein GOP47_0028516 [Adiantum capillus-veneris]|nr:hypothetical protein GOP47_0028516 [Adiantum capillus-veneris]